MKKMTTMVIVGALCTIANADIYDDYKLIAKGIIANKDGIERVGTRVSKLEDFEKNTTVSIQQIRQINLEQNQKLSSLISEDNNMSKMLTNMQVEIIKLKKALSQIRRTSQPKPTAKPILDDETRNKLKSFLRN